NFEAVLGTDQPGELRWSMYTLTKAPRDVPDTNDFILSVRDVSGKVLYEGKYGDSPTVLQVRPGTYSVKALSGEFLEPGFDSPQYGDEQTVVVESGQRVTVRLACALLNCGVQLDIAPEFPASYPGASLFLEQTAGRLECSASENRTAYFFPGEVSLGMSYGGDESLLLTRSLRARDILRLKVSALPETQGGSIEVGIDTTRNWIDDSYVIGGSGDTAGDGPENAISVGDAASHAGEKEVWIYGYIVGGDLSSRGAGVKTSGITKNTHFALAARSSVTEKASCVAVELPSGSLRDALNLVDHPEFIGKQLFLKGDLVEKYFGTTGLKNTNDYSMK
ncbi:MAG: DUF4493 domain-containing protein, partial [Bacteroidales bacterium]|nr:DUF4493 domain-containing protein [Bacteroidales bacterium]